jgi:hypothetical protein
VPLTAPERLRLDKPNPPVRPPKAKPVSSPLITTTSATDDSESAIHKTSEEGKAAKKKKKTSGTNTSRKTATKSAVPAEPSPSHLKATVLTPPSHSSNKISSPSPLKTSATHDRYGGKSPLANKHNNTIASASHDASEHSPRKRRSDEETNSTRYKIPKRSELSKLPSSRSDSEGMGEFLYLIASLNHANFQLFVFYLRFFSIVYTSL